MAASHPFSWSDPTVPLSSLVGDGTPSSTGPNPNDKDTDRLIAQMEDLRASDPDGYTAFLQANPNLRDHIAVNALTGRLMAKKNLWESMSPWEKAAVFAIGGIAGGAALAPALAGSGASTGAAVAPAATGGAEVGASTAVPAIASAGAVPGASIGAAPVAAGGVGAAAAPAASHGLLSALGGPLGQTAIGAGTSVLGAYLQSRAQNKATDANAKALGDALDFEKGVYADQTRIAQPFINTGTQATGNLANYLNNPYALPTADQVRQSPGYQYGMDETARKLEGSAFARGVGLTGRAGQALSHDLNDYALSQYAQYNNMALGARQQNVGENQSAVEQALRAASGAKPS